MPKPILPIQCVCCPVERSCCWFFFLHVFLFFFIQFTHRICRTDGNTATSMARSNVQHDKKKMPNDCDWRFAITHLLIAIAISDRYFCWCNSNDFLNAKEFICLAIAILCTAISFFVSNIKHEKHAKSYLIAYWNAKSYLIANWYEIDNQN